MIGEHLQRECERAGQIPKQEDEEGPLEVLEAEDGGAVDRLLALLLPALDCRRLALLQARQDLLLEQDELRRKARLNFGRWQFGSKRASHYIHFDPEVSQRLTRSHCCTSPACTTRLISSSILRQEREPGIT